jgi:hypothetical protein
MNSSVLLKIQFEKTTFKLKNVVLSSLDDLKSIVATKFPGQAFQHVSFKAKLDDGRSEQISSDADLLNAINLAPLKKNSKNLFIKLIPHPKKTNPLPAKTLPDCVKPHPINQIPNLNPKPKNPLNRLFNDLKNRSKAQFDSYSVSDEKELHCQSPTPIAFTSPSGGPPKLYTYENESAFDVILDHQENIATRMYLKFQSPTDPAQVPQKTVLKIYADMSVQLWSDPETLLLGYGWINANNQTINLHLTLECEEGESVKLELWNRLGEVTNSENGRTIYWFGETAVIGIIPQNQFKFGMGSDGIFFGRGGKVQGWDKV